MEGIIDAVMRTLYKVHSLKHITFYAADYDEMPSAFLSIADVQHGARHSVTELKGMVRCSCMPELLEIMQGLQMNCHNQEEEGYQFILQSLHTSPDKNLTIVFNLAVRQRV